MSRVAAARCAAATGLLGALLAGGGQSLAAPAVRVQVTQPGDFVILGNTQGQDCGPGVPAPVVGNVSAACGTQTSDTSADVSWEADFPTAGQATADQTIGADKRTTAVLTLPPGAVVTHAYLYWAATRFVPAIDTSVVVERPGIFQAAVNAVTSYTAIQGSTYHAHSVADVSSLVQSGGPGAYRISGIESAFLPGVDQDILFAGWWMVVLYQQSGAPVRRVAVFDGLDVVSPGSSASVMATGFLIPSGAAAGKLGVIGFDGDEKLTGDSVAVNGVPLSNALNPATNFFNSTRSTLGAPVSVAGDLPQLTGGPRSMSQIDLDVADLSVATAAGQTSALIQASTTGDVFLLGGLVTSIATASPDLTTSTKTVTDLNGGVAIPGDLLQYAVTVTNSGQDTATGVGFTDLLPSSVTFVPGSLAVTQGPNLGGKTDGAGDDQAEYDAAAGKITARLGATAGLSGGTLAPGASTTLVFEVVLKASAAGAVANQGVVSAAGLLGSPVQLTGTDGNGSSPGAPPTVIMVDASYDSDSDGLPDGVELAAGTDPDDADSDDDGVLDGSEPSWNVDSDGDGLINALDPDSDNDGLFDGTELGRDCDNPATDALKGHCLPDADLGATLTHPLVADTDGGGVSDGVEDTNHNGKVDPGERDPQDPLDDSASSSNASSSSSVSAGSSGGVGSSSASGSGGRGGASSASSASSASGGGHGGSGGDGGVEAVVVQGGCLCDLAGQSGEGSSRGGSRGGASALAAAALGLLRQRRPRR